MLVTDSTFVPVTPMSVLASSTRASLNSVKSRLSSSIEPTPPSMGASSVHSMAEPSPLATHHLPPSSESTCGSVSEPLTPTPPAWPTTRSTSVRVVPLTSSSVAGAFVPMPILPAEGMVVPVSVSPVPKIMLAITSWPEAVAEGASTAWPMITFWLPVVILSPAA